MDFELVGRSARLPVEIARRIEEAIRLGRYKPGERLPTETALATGFGVSRNLERDALGVEANFAFHRAIALAGQNPYFCDLLDYLSTQIGRGVTLVRRSPGKDRRIIKEIHGEHVAIFEAIAARDPEHAREAMRIHLTRTAARLGLGIGVAAAP